MITEETRIRILAESPVHGPILLAELDRLMYALKMSEDRLTNLEDELGDDL